MTTMQDMVFRLRSMLHAGQPDDLSVLNSPYIAGSGEAVLRYPKKNLAPGSVVSIGLTTMQVLETDTSGATLRGVVGVDGSPDIGYPANTIVRTKPSHTTWAMFDEMNSVIASLSSPRLGLWWPQIVTPTEINRRDGVYPLPSDVAVPMRLVQARWRWRGSDAWSVTGLAEYQPEHHAIRIYGDLPDAAEVQFVLGMAFTLATSLDDTLATLGLVGLDDLVQLGAAQTLALSTESRRNSPWAQGDARRSEEVLTGSNLGVSREYGRQFQARVDDEYSRLLRLFPIIRNGSPIFDRDVEQTPRYGTWYR